MAESMSENQNHKVQINQSLYFLPASLDGLTQMIKLTRPTFVKLNGSKVSLHKDVIVRNENNILE